MKKYLVTLALLAFLVCSSDSLAQKVMIGPRLTGNLNIFNSKGLTGTWNGIGIGIGGTVDVSFSQHIGLMTNVTVFDMRNFSNSLTEGQTTKDDSRSLAYVTIDPMFKAEFSGFYMLGGASLGIKIASSGERTTTTVNQTPQVATGNFDTKSVKFDFAVGTGYNFVLSRDKMYLGTDFMAYIPLTDTYNTPGSSNSIFTLKLGASLKFVI